MSQAHGVDELAAELLAHPPKPEPTVTRTRYAVKFEQMVARTEKRNFNLGVWNGILYNLGMYFMAKSTIIPMFLSTLTSSSALIGIVSQFDNIGWYLPQILFATFVVHRPQKMPLYKLSMTIGMVAYFIIALITLLNPSPGLLLTFFIVSYGIYHLSSGMRGVVFMELLAKAIPSRRRAKFLGWRMAIGAISVALLGAPLINELLTRSSFPTNFGYVFLVGAVVTTVSFLSMAAMREPRTPNVPPKRTFREQLVIARRILREDKQFRTLVISRLLINTWTIGLPFIILFGTNRFGFGLKHTDIFITAECIGLIISNFLWQKIELQYGPRKVLIGSCIVAMLVPLFILSMSFFEPPVYLFAILFGLTASFDAAVTVGGLGYLIEMTGDADRSTYVGIFNTLMALPCFLTAGAGILLDVLGFEALYGIVFVIALASLFRVRHLPNIQLKHSS